MTRRELFQRFIGAAAAAGVAAPTATEALDLAASDADRTFAVLRFDKILSHEQRQRVREAWQQATEGTAWEPVRVLVLDRDAEFKVYTR